MRLAVILLLIGVLAVAGCDRPPAPDSAPGPKQPPAAGTYEGKPVVQWAAELKDGSGEERRRAAQVLEQVAREVWRKERPATGFKEAVPSLIAVLKNGDRESKQVAALALAAAGPEAKEALPVLREMLVLENEIVQRLLKENQGIWRDRDLILRNRLVDALGRIGPDAKEVLPLLFELVRSDDDSGMFRSDLAGAIRDIDPEGKQMVPMLEKMLQDSSPRQRALGSHLLEYYTESVPAALPMLQKSIPLLEKATKDDDAIVRRNATAALTAINRAGR